MKDITEKDKLETEDNDNKEAKQYTFAQKLLSCAFSFLNGVYSTLILSSDNRIRADKNGWAIFADYPGCYLLPHLCKTNKRCKSRINFMIFNFKC